MTDNSVLSSSSCLIVHPVLMRGEDDVSARVNVYRTPESQRDEAAGLAAAIDLKVVDAMICKVGRVSPGSLLGTGQRERIKAQIDALAPDVVIVNHHLSPVQQRNLEQEWDVKVIDRTGLILEIFGARAQTAEGKIQVELAALNYQRSRLVRSWTHLERQRGGAGFMGGPGESQLEIDRRLIDDKIARLKRELEDVRKHRELERKGREKVPFPIVAIVGYTNAGKSTLFNALTGSQVFAKDLLFATLDTTMRRLELPNGQITILSDTVGFISDLPTHLVAAFRATLEQLQHATVILHVRDVTAPDFDAQRADVIAIMQDLGIDAAQDSRVVEVWNKIDALDEDGRANVLRLAREDGRIIPTSAQSGIGLEDLKLKIQAIIAATHTVMTYRLGVQDGKAQAWLYQHANVIDQTIDNDTIVLHVEIDPVMDQRFRAYHPNATSGK